MNPSEQLLTPTAGRDVGGDVSVVVLAKDRTVAKTRLELERRSAEAVALHLAVRTVRAALAAEHVGRVLVVTSDDRIGTDAAQLGAEVVSEGRPRGVNRAAALGLAHALRDRPGTPVAVMVADLPLLVPDDIDEVVAQFLRGEAPLYVPDHHVAGTTFVIHSHDMRPGFGFGRQSAVLHRRLGYRSVHRAPRGLRVDMDVPEDVRDFLPRSGRASLDSLQLDRLLREPTQGRPALSMPLGAGPGADRRLVLNASKEF